MKKFEKILTFGLLGTSLFVSGCGKKDSREQKLVIAFGIDEDLEMKVKAKDQFLKDLEASVGMKVEWFEPSSDMALRESLRAKKNRTDIAYTGAMPYFITSQRTKIEPLVSFAKDGKKQNWGKFSYFITRPDTNINGFTKEDLINPTRPYTFAYTKQSSGSTYLWPVNDLISSKIIKDTNDFNTKFKPYETGSTTNTVRALLDKDADIGVISSNSYIKNRKFFTPDNHKIIYKSSVIPDNLWLIQQDLPKELKQKLENFFLNYNDPSFMQNFYGKKDGEQHIKVELKDFDIIEQVMKNLNLIELSTD
ncbi:phosphate/phosphite/phosphonate ABC transporter substrate-binding protein [Cetobacterium sp.]|uniref:phosphate/phosphite/phosphonate ABC transporter substrate-binding protein n=1 Tax=Cetobacterium sp. TaxID=2071632 RepID=UPI003F415449